MNNLQSNTSGCRRSAPGTIFFLFSFLLLTGLDRQAGAQTYTLSNVWNVAASSDNLTSGTDGGNRSIAYSAIFPTRSL